jgi:hypothetical protein
MRQYKYSIIHNGIEQKYHTKSDCQWGLRRLRVPINTNNTKVYDIVLNKELCIYDLYIEKMIEIHVVNLDRKHKSKTILGLSFKDNPNKSMFKYPFILTVKKKLLKWGGSDFTTPIVDKNMVKDFMKHLKVCDIQKSTYVYKEDAFCFNNQEDFALALLFGEIEYHYNINDIMKKIVDKYPKSAIIA